MRALFLASVCLLLAGCESITRLDGDSFAVGPAGVEAFETDDGLCHSQADTYVSYDLHVIGDDRYATNRAYNQVYADCMTQKGHARRDYALNWLPG